MLHELRWKTSVSATCLHAAACRAAGFPAVAPELAAALDAAAETLASEIANVGWPVPIVLERLTGLAAEIDNNRELVTRAMSRLHLRPVESDGAVRVAGVIADLEAAMHRAQPALAEDLAARVRPIREQWEARGPGILREIGRLTEESVIPAAAEVVLVAPYAGGHGWAHTAYNRVTLEAMLFNPLSELPEVVRLAWLLSQLNGDLPRYADVLPAGQRVDAFRLAMIPPVLAAAEAVELGRSDPAALEHALVAWRLPQPPPGDAAERLWNWWTAWLDHPTKWPVAVAALEQMLR
jgi:hypothetical protein